jgi:Cu(I)/Ag(I) efflux system membrane fusion protein/cobalt-zinc-cadmium efflux system membrane fusion protein
VDFDERKVYTVTTKVMGWADKLYANYTGALIKKGQPLFDLYSPDLVSAQNEYLQSLSYLKSIQESGAEESIKTAEQMVQSARKRLLNWDIPESEIAALGKAGAAKKNLTIYSPDDGFVVDKMVLEGQQVMPGMALYKIANLSKVWVMGNIYQYELAWVKTGQEAKVDLSYLPGRKFSGTITYISPTIDDATKTAKVRVEIPNTPDFDLKPGMFATVVLTSTLPEPVIAVPEQAIIRSGARNLAVVSLGNGYFEPREVELGVSGGGYVQALSGIAEGEQIVVSSQFLIDSESNLKAAVQQMTIHQGSTVVPAPAQGATAEKPMQQMHHH